MESIGRGVDPSGQLTLPNPLAAGGPAESLTAAAMPVLDPVSPAKTTVGNAPVVATRTDVYQAPSKTSVTSQKLLPTAKATPRAAVNAGGPDDPDQPTCKRKGCDHSPWNGKAGFYCSTACKDKDFASKICEAPGCANARYEGSPYCSLDCMEKAKAKKVETGTSVPNVGEPVMGPMFNVIQSNVAGKNVGVLPFNPRTSQKRLMTCLLIRAN